MCAVSVSVAELDRGLSPEVLENAFGEDSLGILLVSGLPPAFADLRTRVLTSVSVLANLPAGHLEALERSSSMWLTGWSRGREKLQASGEPDFNKGSFYVNCAFCQDNSLEAPAAHIVDKYPDAKMYTEPNVWPSSDIAGLETFETDCKNLCKMIVDIGAKVAKSCDAYIGASFPDYRKGFLERVTRTSTCTKARFLHYYPSQKEAEAEKKQLQEEAKRNDQDAEDTWCGEHVDHSCLTGLTSALYMDEAGALDHSPDSAAGLYIRDRHGQIVQVKIPADCLAFQSGSTLQEVSHQSFRAVPHYVKGSSVPGVARNTLAVFCQPDLDEKITATEDFAEYAKRVVETNHGG